MYFEGDPLIKQCPIVRTINNDDAVRTLIAELDMHAAVPLDCLAYRFDLVLRGHRATLFENRTQGRPMKEYLPETASQTAGPYVHIGSAPDAAGFHIFEKILARSSLPLIPPGAHHH